MNPTDARAEEVCRAALALAGGVEREAFISAECREDLALETRVRRLLQEHDDTSLLPEGVVFSPEFEAGLARFKPEAAGDQIGPYKLREQIGEGGFGTVWVADQSEPVNRRVALKIVKLGMDTKEVLARFEQERKALALMDHPNIARVLDAGATEWGRPFFVMELVRGIKITDFCDQAQLPTAERLRLFMAVCRAVQHAHQKGIIHRDLKPSNILVSLHDDVAVPKVIDFGVAKATQSRLTDLTIYTQFQQLLGTPLYMSPEQAEMGGMDVDTRSDIYSLGVLLYELLTGRTPFDPDTLKRAGLDEIRRMIREDELPKPSTVLATMSADVRTGVAQRRQSDPSKLSSQLRGDLDWIVMKALEKDRTRRYETANGLAMDIGRHLANEPVLARPPSRLYRCRRFVRRHKVGVACAAGVAVVLVLGSGISTWQAVRAERALALLRNTAPAFAAQAREFVIQEEFEEAIKKLSFAIQLQPDSAEYLYDRAALLQSRLDLSGAAMDFRRILKLRPGDARAQANAELCERLAAEPRKPGEVLSHTALAELYAAMSAEHRPAAQLRLLAQKLGREHLLLREYWLDRLQLLPNASSKPIAQRLTAEEHGTLDFDLSGTKVADLSPLRGMKLGKLDLSGCPDVHSIEALKGMPLRTLNLTGTSVASLEPLSGARNLEDLTLSETDVTDLAPLRGLPLQRLELVKTRVSDLSALAGMRLTSINIGNSWVKDLSPLAEMPLKTLVCSYTPMEDYMPLAKLPLERLILRGVPVGNLEFARALPLKVLDLGGATKLINIRALLEMKTLEVLVLPGDLLMLGDDEIAGIDLLKGHPALQRIYCTLAKSGSPDSAEAASIFWRKWDAIMQWWRPLRTAGIKVNTMRRSDDRWGVYIHGEPLRELSMFAGATNVSELSVDSCREISDLSPLTGLQLKTLSIGHTAVKDLSPLKTMRLQGLWMGYTNVTDLSPLRGMPLKMLFMDHCPLLVDLAPLQEMPELEEVLLPESAAQVTSLKSLSKLRRISYTWDRKAARPASAVAEFWKHQHDLTWLRALQAAGGPVSAEQLENGTWKVSLSDAAFSDLSILKDAHISELRLNGTGVTELRPLIGLPLRLLRLDTTPCADVSALALIPTIESLVLPPHPTGMAALRKLPALKRLAYGVDAAGNPSLDAAAFWATFEAKEKR